MRSRQRKTITLEVNDRQKAVIERNIAALPRELGVEPERTGSDLPALFYHPNAAARVLALVVSAGYDVARGRSENAEKKVNRAVEVLTLVIDDETGRDHLKGLAERLGSEQDGFLAHVHDGVVPYLQDRMGQLGTPAKKAKPAVAAMPRAVEEGEALPIERRAGKKAAPKKSRKPKADAVEAAPEEAPVADAPVDEAPAVEEAPAAAAEAEAVEAAPAAEAAPVDAETTDESGEGPSAAEAAAAAAAALAAIEAPYEDVVEDDAAPRFDPDRDLKPNEGRRRRRRSKNPEGLERMKPDQRPDLEMMAQDGAAPEASEAPAEEAAAPAADGPEELCRVSRHGDASDVTDLALEILRQLLRKAGGLETDGRVKLEMTLTTAEGEAPPQRRRRRRRRRGGRSD